MTLEIVNTVASVCTLVVVATAAVAAVVQLRHMRGSNQIAALVECRQILASPEFTHARNFVKRQLPEILRDPANHGRFQESPLEDELSAFLTVGNFLENLGVLIKYGMVDRRIACDLWGGVVLECWNSMAPALAIIRSVNGADVWENFEYLASICQDWLVAHPNGAYPRGAKRLPTTIPSAAVIAQAMPVELATAKSTR